MHSTAPDAASLLLRIRARRRALYAALSVVAGIALPLLVCEAALRIVGWPKGPPVGWKSRAKPAELNELGFRGHRATGPSDDTVFLVGDSQVEQGSYAEMAEAYLAAALKELTRRDVRVVSVAASGWGQDQQLLALRRYVPELKPRVVALWFTPSNDLWNNTFPTHYTKRGRPKPTFWLEGDELRGPHAPWLARRNRERIFVLRLVNRVRGIPPYVTDEEWESRLPPAYQATALATGESVPALRDYVAQQRGVTPEDVRYFDEENFANEKTHFSIALSPRSARLEYAAKLTRALLREMLALCQQHGSQLVVFSYDEDLPEIPDAPTRFAIDGRVVTLSRASAKALVSEVLTVGPTFMIQGLPPGSTISKTDRHLNPAGNRYAMEALARWLVSQHLGGFAAAQQTMRR